MFKTYSNSLCTYKAGQKNHVKHFSLRSAWSKTKFKNWSYQVTHFGVFNILFQDIKGGCLFSFGISPEPHTQQSKSQCISLRWTLKLPPLLSSSYYAVFKSKFSVSHPLKLILLIQIMKKKDSVCTVAQKISCPRGYSVLFYGIFISKECYNLHRYWKKPENKRYFGLACKYFIQLSMNWKKNNRYL